MFYTARVRQKAQSKDFSTTTAVTVGHDFSHDLRKSKEVQSIAWNLRVCNERYIAPEVLKLTPQGRHGHACDHSGENSPPRTDICIS